MVGKKREMKHYAILIGVDQVNKESYKKEYSLGCAKVNVTQLKKQLESIKDGKDLSIEIFDNKPKWSDVECYMKKLKADTIGKEALITFYYFGHSYQLNDDLEIYHLESTQYLYFYDKMVLDYKFLEAFKGFSESVKIHLILDTCYSGKIPDYEINISDKWKSIKSFDELLKALSNVNLNLVVNRGLAELYSYKMERYEYFVKYKGKPIKLKNMVLTYSAANGENVAYENGSNNPSFFTDKMLRLSKNCNGNYMTFFKALQTYFGDNAKPYMYPEICNELEYFQKYIPFKLNKIANLKNPICKMGLNKIELDNNTSSSDRVTGKLTFDEKYQIVSPSGIQAFPGGGSTHLAAKPFLDVFKHAMFIRVSKSDVGEKVITIEHDDSKLRYTGTSEPINGIVLIYDIDENKVIGGQPTKGTVTNQLGED